MNPDFDILQPCIIGFFKLWPVLAGQGVAKVVDHPVVYNRIHLEMMGTRTTFTYLAKIVLFLNRNSSRVQNSCIAKARVATTEPESFNFWPGRLSKIYKNTI